MRGHVTKSEGSFHHYGLEWVEAGDAAHHPEVLPQLPSQYRVTRLQSGTPQSGRKQTPFRQGRVSSCSKKSTFLNRMPMSGLGPSNELTGTSQRHAGIGSHEAECIGGVQVLVQIRKLFQQIKICGWVIASVKPAPRPMCALSSHLCLQRPSSAFPGCVLWKPSEHAHSIYKSSQREATRGAGPSTRGSPASLA